MPQKVFKIMIDGTPPKKAIGFILLQGDDGSDSYKSRVKIVKEIEWKTRFYATSTPEYAIKDPTSKLSGA